MGRRRPHAAGVDGLTWQRGVLKFDYVFCFLQKRYFGWLLSLQRTHFVRKRSTTSKSFHLTVSHRSYAFLAPKIAKSGAKSLVFYQTAQPKRPGRSKCQLAGGFGADGPYQYAHGSEEAKRRYRFVQEHTNSIKDLAGS